jgi:membrane dipeptidase
MALPKRADIPSAIRDLHAEATIIDLHGDTFMWSKLLGYDIGKRHKNRLPLAPIGWHIDLPRMRDVGCDGQIFGVVVNPFFGLDRRYKNTHSMIDEMHRSFEKYPEQFGLATDSKEFKNLREQGKIAALIGVEGAHCLGGRIEAVEEFKNKGAAYISLAHLTNNECCKTNKDLTCCSEGLSELGFEVVAEVERCKLIFDMAHINETGFFDIMKARKGKGPVIASHTGVKGAYDHWRNLSDDMVKAIADSDGCIGIMYQSTFIHSSLFSNLDHVVAHYQHVKKLVGARYLALGSDFDGFIFNPKGITGIESLPAITEALLKGGFTEDEVVGILGNNFMRVFEAICG